MDQSYDHFRRGVDLYNRGDFFEAHEQMEEAMNLLEDDTSDWDFYLGLLRAAVANHKLTQGHLKSAAIHLTAALKFLAPYSDRHRDLKLREFRSALSAELARVSSIADAPPGGASVSSGMPRAPRIEIIQPAAGREAKPHET